MTTFVLVHGAWHGAWCWRRVTRLLTARSHEVFAPRPAAFFKVNDKDQAWVDALCVPHPIRCFTQKVSLSGARERIPGKTYIRAAGYANEGFDAARAKARERGWRVYDVPCGHDVM